MPDARKGDRHKEKAIIVRLPPEMHEQLNQAAAERLLSAAFLVRYAIQDMLDRLIPVDEWKLTR